MIEQLLIKQIIAQLISNSSTSETIEESSQQPRKKKQMKKIKELSMLQMAFFCLLIIVSQIVLVSSIQLINSDFQSHNSFNMSCPNSMCQSGNDQQYNFIMVPSDQSSWYTMSGRSYKIRSKIVNGIMTSVLDVFGSGYSQKVCQNIIMKKGYRYKFGFDGVISDQYDEGYFYLYLWTQQIFTRVRDVRSPARYSILYKSYFSNNRVRFCLAGDTDQMDYQNGPLFDNVTAEQIQAFCDVANCTTCVEMQPLNCQICQSQFYNNITSCVLCSNAIDQCIQCTNSTFCTKCSPEYVFVPTLQECIKIKYSCFTSISNCDECASITSCFSCTAPYIMSEDTTFCFQCSVLVPHCETCLSSSECEQCSTGYLLNDNKQCLWPMFFQIQKVYQSTQIDNLVIIQTNLTKAWVTAAGISQDNFIRVLIDQQNQIIVNIIFDQTGCLKVYFKMVYGYLFCENISIEIQNSIQSVYYIYFRPVSMISIERYSDASLSYMDIMNSATIEGLYKVLAPVIKAVKYCTLGSLVNSVLNNINVASMYGYSFYHVKIPKNVKIALQRTFQQFSLYGIFKILSIQQNFIVPSDKNAQRIKASSFPWKGKLDFSFTSQLILNNLELLFIFSLSFVRIIIFFLLQLILKWRVVHVNYKKFTMISMEYQSFTPYFLISAGSYFATYISAVHFIQKFRIIFQFTFLTVSLFAPFIQYANSYINSENIAKNNNKMLQKKIKKKHTIFDQQLTPASVKKIQTEINRQLKISHQQQLLCLTQNISIFAIPFCIAIENRMALAVVGTLVMILKIFVAIKSIKILSCWKCVYPLSMAIIWIIYHLIFVTFYVFQTINVYQTGALQQTFKILGFIALSILPLIGILPTIQLIINLIIQTKIVIVQFCEQYKQNNRVNPKQQDDSKQIQAKGLIFNFNPQNEGNAIEVKKTQNNQQLLKEKDGTSFDKMKKRVNFDVLKPTNQINSITPQFFEAMGGQQQNKSQYQSPLFVKIKHTKDSSMRPKPYLITTYHDA